MASLTDAQLIKRMQENGIVIPKICLAESRRAGIPVSLGCAILMQESDGGHNEFGHDPTIFVGAGKVTKAKYERYHRERGTPGRHMQGVGPCQLTWWEFQDKADRLGGCHRPTINVRVGFGDLAGMIKAKGDERKGIAAYNGTGKAAQQYASSVLHRKQHWHDILT